MKLKGAQIVAQTLIEQNIDTVFGYPGGNVIDLYDALYEEQDKLHHIITAHEQGAAHAADGYARATGRVGVVSPHPVRVLLTLSRVLLPRISIRFRWLQSREMYRAIFWDVILFRRLILSALQCR